MLRFGNWSASEAKIRANFALFDPSAVKMGGVDELSDK